MNLIFALAENGANHPGEESAIVTTAIVLVVIALLYAIVATWIATPASAGDDH